MKTLYYYLPDEGETINALTEIEVNDPADLDEVFRELADDLLSYVDELFGYEKQESHDDFEGVVVLLDYEYNELGRYKLKAYREVSVYTTMSYSEVD